MRPLDDASARAAEAAFKAYYFENLARIRAPPLSPQREFGYQRFNSGMVRHQRAKDDRELRLLIMRSSPSDLYVSNGCYSFPDLPMNEKDWRGADLIFDIDAKDLALPCRPSHTVLVCGECGLARMREGGEGGAKSASTEPAAGACPGCGSARHESVSLPCPACIDGAKKQVRLLVRLLGEDLGVPRESVAVYFSGNEGFHVHAHGTPYEPLGTKERGEIADYLMFRGAKADSYGFKRGSAPGKSDLPGHDEAGWRGRVARHVLGPKSARPKSAAAAAQAGYAAYQARLEEASQAIGVRLDRAVTADIHRIFRMPGSLSGKSGLAKAECADLDAFSPYADACLIDDEPVDVTSSAAPGVQFRLRGRRFGPYKPGEQATVPRYAAVYMICKRLARAAAPPPPSDTAPAPPPSSS